MKTINVEVGCDNCPFMGEFSHCNLINTHTIENIVPQDCPLIKSDYLVHLVKDKVINE